MLGVDAQAGIPDGEFGTLRRGFPLQRDGAAGRRVTHGIGHQIAQGAHQFRLRAAQVALAIAFDDDGVAAAG